jgi:hypothetical protein
MENDFKPSPEHTFHFRSKSRFETERLIRCEALLVDEPQWPIITDDRPLES